jgi:hypothetical protein
MQSTHTERALSQSCLLAVQSLSDVHALPGPMPPSRSVPGSEPSRSPPPEFSELPQPPTPKKATRNATASALDPVLTFMNAILPKYKEAKPSDVR